MKCSLAFFVLCGLWHAQMGETPIEVFISSQTSEPPIEMTNMLFISSQTNELPIEVTNTGFISLQLSNPPIEMTKSEFISPQIKNPPIEVTKMPPSKKRLRKSM